jgi:hypothetical protein
MRHALATTAAVGFLAAATIPLGSLPAAAQDATPHVLTLGAPESPDAPVVLRGSAVGPGSAPAVAADTPSYQMAAGRRLWFFDPQTLQIRSCINQQTSTVGLRIVRCYRGSLGGHRRTFGPAFQP